MIHYGDFSSGGTPRFVLVPLDASGAVTSGITKFMDMN